VKFTNRIIRWGNRALRTKALSSRCSPRERPHETSLWHYSQTPAEDYAQSFDAFRYTRNKYYAFWRSPRRRRCDPGGLRPQLYLCWLLRSHLRENVFHSPLERRDNSPPTQVVVEAAELQRNRVPRVVSRVIVLRTQAYDIPLQYFHTPQIVANFVQPSDIENGAASWKQVLSYRMDRYMLNGTPLLSFLGFENTSSRIVRLNADISTQRQPGTVTVRLWCSGPSLPRHQNRGLGLIFPNREFLSSLLLRSYVLLRPFSGGAN
jgi:hypothetical protein